MDVCDPYWYEGRVVVVVVVVAVDVWENIRPTGGWAAFIQKNT